MVFFGAALPAAYCCLEVGPLGPADSGRLPKADNDSLGGDIGTAARAALWRIVIVQRPRLWPIVGVFQLSAACEVILSSTSPDRSRDQSKKNKHTITTSLPQSRKAVEPTTRQVRLQVMRTCFIPLSAMNLSSSACPNTEYPPLQPGMRGSLRQREKLVASIMKTSSRNCRRRA